MIEIRGLRTRESANPGSQSVSHPSTTKVFSLMLAET